jgi:thymidylate kinase
MKKLALEGTSFSGKTTLAKELARYNPNRYKMVEEYVSYAGGSQNFPSYPPKNRREALSNLDFFLNLERQRHTDIEKYKDESCIVVMDRSVISLLGFRFAERYIGGLNIFCEAKAIIQQEPQLAPDIIVYLHATDIQIEQRRQKSHRRVGDMFVNSDFNYQLRRFFDWLIAQREYLIITIKTDKLIEKVKKELIVMADQVKG